MRKVIFMMRGLGREKGHWAGFPEHLARSLPGVEIEEIDLPGFGEANDETAPWSIAGTAERLKSRGVFNKYEDYDERYLLGLSLGGMVSLQAALDRPKFFNGCIILNSSQKYKNALFNRLNFKLIPKAVYAMFFASCKQRESMIFDFTINSGRDKDSYVAEWVRCFNERPFKTKSFVAQVYAASRFSLKNKDIKGIEGIILCSKADKLVSWRSSQVIADILNWPIFYHDNAGHDISFDDPSWICNKVNEFIQKEK